MLKANFDISYMRLFGSVVKNEYHNGSDIDLFVVMPPKANNMNQLLMSPSSIQDLAGNCMTIMAIGEGFRKIDNQPLILHFSASFSE